MPGHGPPAVLAAVAEQAAARHHHDAADRGRDLGRRGARAPLRAAALAVRADGHRRQPLRRCASPARSPAGRRCSSSTAATTARSTRPSPSPTADGGVARAAGNVGPPVDPARHHERRRVQRPRRARGRARATGDVACVLAEPAHDEHRHRPARRRLPRRRCAPSPASTGTLLIIDETHTLCAGPGGCTAAWGLEPDLLTRRQGDRPAACRRRRSGCRREVAATDPARPDADYEDTGGVGGTLAGNALSPAAMRATLASVLTDGRLRAHDPARRPASPTACAASIAAARRALARHPAGLPRRVPVPPEPPRNGTQAARRRRPRLDASCTSTR